MFTEEDRRYLLEIAHRSLIEAAAGRRYQPEGPHPDHLMAPAAAFVTLWKRDGALRGCIGQVEAVMPLISSIARMAPLRRTRASLPSRRPRSPSCESTSPC